MKAQERLNYVHGAIGSPARNQKFFSLWMDGYSGAGDGSTVWLGFHPTGDGTDSTLAVTYSLGGYTSSIAYQQDTFFIDSSEDRGRWMRVVFRVRAESSDGASDGVLETWRRWEDEATYTKLHEVLDIPLRVAAAGPHGFKAGYLMGWANGHYEESTDWLLDLFEISDEPLISE